MATLSSSVTAPADRLSDRMLCARWLLCVAGLVALMVVVGGVTRLTESGLSIVYWKPVTGVIPPLSEAAWQAEFALYQSSPEYLKVNRGMSLGQFQFIYWWEYGHRLLGRLIGLAFALPLLVLAIMRRIPPGYGPVFVGLLVLGGLQGLMGWYMVQSGLVDRPEVSHYRLTAHLMLALVIFVGLMWTAASLLRIKRDIRRLPLATIIVLTVLLLAQLSLGGFVAGLKAGHAFNTWPLMDGGLVPRGLWLLEPWWRNFLDNPGGVQLLHRLTAYALFAVSLWAAFRLKARAGWVFFAAVTGQAILGIAALLTHVPIVLGAAHQFGGVIVLTALLWLMRKHGSMP